ncbi:MAG: 4'-phosphopantetheinyl transferase superfamily protein [Proteobacteria bacterium]|nr:4'-phosphopantetheinyl transferase superfamily protein [Pseudomonadota bacterium]
MHDPALLAALERQPHVWYAWSERMPLPALAERYLSLLDAEETARYHRFYFDKDRQHYLAAHALLRLTLSRYAPLHPQAWRFERGAKGKPDIAADMGLPRLRFNLSHTQGLVACVIALDCRCGIDVEHQRSMRDMHGVAETVFSTAEIAWLRTQPEEKQAETFFTFWTLKEAYIKATGEGLSAPLQNISFDIANPSIAVTFGQAVADETAHWTLQHWKLANGHQLAVAADMRTIGATQMHEWDLSAK